MDTMYINAHFFKKAPFAKKKFFLIKKSLRYPAIFARQCKTLRGNATFFFLPCLLRRAVLIQWSLLLHLCSFFCAFPTGYWWCISSTRGESTGYQITTIFKKNAAYFVHSWCLSSFWVSHVRSWSLYANKEFWEGIPIIKLQGILFCGGDNMTR